MNTKRFSPSEEYYYSRPGKRVRKLRVNYQHHYLPGLEIIIGKNSVLLDVNALNILHIIRDPYKTQLRFTITDHNQSVTLELDNEGKFISCEVYYPFGGTALWASCNDYKSLRYGGKIRDFSGLIYHGWRYYAPWLLRWINCDPSGIAGGYNLYGMVCNNPLTLCDPGGLAPEKIKPTSDTFSKSDGENSQPIHDDRQVIECNDDLSQLELLPTETLQKIYDQLSPEDLKNVYRTSHRLQKSISDQQLKRVGEYDKTCELVQFVQSMWGNTGEFQSFQAAWFTHKDLIEQRQGKIISQARVFTSAAEILYQRPYNYQDTLNSPYFDPAVGIFFLNHENATSTPFFNKCDRPHLFNTGAKSRAKEIALEGLKLADDIYCFNTRKRRQYDLQRLKRLPDLAIHDHLPLHQPLQAPLYRTRRQLCSFL